MKSTSVQRLTFGCLIFLVQLYVIVSPVRGADEQVATPEPKVQAPAPADDLAALREENKILKEEINQLRLENKQLRRLLAVRGLAADTAEGTIAPTVVPVRQTPIPTETTNTTENATSTVTQTHWLSAGSGKRHNNTCRYFKSTEGRFCSPTEGSPCKRCGG